MPSLTAHEVAAGSFDCLLLQTLPPMGLRHELSCIRTGARHGKNGSKTRSTCHSNCTVIRKKKKKKQWQLEYSRRSAYHWFRLKLFLRPASTLQEKVIQFGTEELHYLATTIWLEQRFMSHKDKKLEAEPEIEAIQYVVYTLPWM